MSVKHSNFVNLDSSSEEHQNEKTPSSPPRKKTLSPPQAPSKSISSNSTHYTSSSTASESPTPTHVAPPPKLRFVILLKLEPQELPPQASSSSDPYVSTMGNWPSGPSNPSPPPCVTRPPPGFKHLPPGFEQQQPPPPLFVKINNNGPHQENTQHLPPNLGNQYFPHPATNILDFHDSNGKPIRKIKKNIFLVVWLAAWQELLLPGWSSVARQRVVLPGSWCPRFSTSYLKTHDESRRI
ncbi:hypothetical protein Tco_0157675 [Tanacetum coccineum]